VATALTVFITGNAFAINWNNIKVGPANIYGLGSTAATIATSTLTGLKAPFSWPAIVASATVYGLIELQKASPWKGILFQPGDKVALPTPPGWTDPNTPPGSIPTQNTYDGYPTAEDACKTSPYYNIYGFEGITGSSTLGVCQPGSYMSFPIVQSCPTGYSVTGSTCTLTDATAAQWPSDGKPTYEQDASHNWQPNPKDTDTITDGPTGSNEFTTKGEDEHGNPVKESYKTRPDGGTEYNRWTQTVNNNGQDTVYQETIVFNDQGQITNIYQNTYNNQTIDNVAPGTGTPSNPVEVKLPNITVSGDGGVLNKTLPQIETADDAVQRFKTHIASNSIIAPLLNAQTVSGTCPMFLSVDLGSFGQHQTNVMCDLYEIMIPTLDVITKFAWSLTAILIFFSA
jgi:hypothetical protein